MWVRDGAPPHVVSSVIRFLTHQFGDKVYLPPFHVSLAAGITPMDFSLWRYLKSKVYAFNPHTASDLKSGSTDSSCVGTCISAIHHLFHAKCHRV